MLPPSVRNSMAKTTCVLESDTTISDCANVQWHPAQPVPCTFYSRTGQQHTGICDPNGKCYEPAQTFAAAIQDINTIQEEFLASDDVDLFHEFDDVYDVMAVLAYSKAALLWTSIQMQLVYLGMPTNPQGKLPQEVLTYMTGEFAAWLQNRYDYHTNATNFVNVTLQTSTGVWQSSMQARWSCGSDGVLATVDMSQLQVCLIEYYYTTMLSTKILPLNFASQVTTLDSQYCCETDYPGIPSRCDENQILHMDRIDPVVLNQWCGVPALSNCSLLVSPPSGGNNGRCEKSPACQPFNTTVRVF